MMPNPTKKKTVLQIGPLPPPTGGVSIHIWRLSHLLKDDFEIDFVDEAKEVKKEFFNIRSLRFGQYFKRILKSDLIYIHSGKNSLRLFHILSGKLLGKKVIMTLHAYPAIKPRYSRYIDEFFYKKADKVISVNAVILERVTLPASKSVIMHAFIPPIMDEENPLPDTVSLWLRKMKEEGRLVICANAWRLDKFNNEDMYGLDMCIEVVKKLKDRGLQLAFIFNVATVEKSKDIFDNYQQRIAELGLRDCFYLVSERLSFVRLIQGSDIVIRPTNLDGDSLTIREALMLGTPILASDVVERPKGTLLFKTRDFADMEEKLSSALLKAKNGAINGQMLEENETIIKSFYTNLIRKQLDSH